MIFVYFIPIICAVGDKVPSIPRIQQFIESAWTNGESFDGIWNHLLYHFYLNHPNRELPESGNLRSGSIFVSLCNNIPAGKAKRKQTNFSGSR